MLVNCPRCGFSQPKDQYCAQCGVDMQAYKPKSVPLMKKIFQSTQTHVLLLLAAAAFIGQYVIRSEEPQRWVQKITRSQSTQGVTKTKSKFDAAEEPTAIAPSSDESLQNEGRSEPPREQLGSLRNKEISVNANVEQPIQAGTSRLSETNAAAVAETGEPLFRILYAEVPVAVVNKWINESSSAGLYQNLQDYSAGIIMDFRKKMDPNIHILKTSEKKLGLGQSDASLSGMVGDDSGQVIGLVANLEFRSHENGNIHGSITINRNQKQNRESFPAEFDLSKGAAFFMLGTLKTNSFQIEREQLNMPPFQIFKSPDFAARKTEFVIILEPEYK